MHKFESWIFAKTVSYIQLVAVETDTEFAGCAIGIMGCFSVFSTSPPNQMPVS